MDGDTLMEASFAVIAELKRIDAALATCASEKMMNDIHKSVTSCARFSDKSSSMPSSIHK